MLTENKAFAKYEIPRILLISILVLFTYWPFVSGFNLNIGGSDARWYQYILHDAIMQFNHGIFPIYVEQSEFGFFGGPVIRAPYYLLLGQALNILTLNKLSALCIQHLTVLFSAFAGAFSLYYLLTKLAPNIRWLAIALSFFYVSCPGVMGLIYHYDMYYSFMTLPFVPLVIYGLSRSQQKNDLIASVITAIGLSLTWMSHPPIALWTTGIIFLFHGLQFIFLRKGLIGFLLTFLLLLLLNLWQFASIYSMGVGDGYGSSGNILAFNPVFATALVQELRNTLPGVLLPLQWTTTSFLPFLQLGYSLWLIVILSIAMSYRFVNSFLVRTLLVCSLSLLLLLYPLPYIGHALWAHIPQIILTITDSCPMERFYIILAATICFMGIFILNTIYSLNNLKLNRIIFIIFLGLIVWNVYQSYYFVSLLIGKNNSWIDSKNIYFAAGQTSPYPYIGSYDPLLKNQLLNQKKVPIAKFNNEQALINKCYTHSIKYVNSIIKSDNVILPSLSNFDIYPNTKYLLCINAHSQSSTSVNIRYNNEVYLGLSNPGEDNVLIPFFIHKKKHEKINIALDSIHSPSPIKFIKAGITSYDIKDMPIQVGSYTPYTAAVKTPSDNLYLKIQKKYFPGYSAKVNGKSVSVLQDNDFMILIPLKEHGLNQIWLQYTGLPLMKVSFYISICAWLVILGSLLMLRQREFLLIKTRKILAEEYK